MDTLINFPLVSTETKVSAAKVCRRSAKSSIFLTDLVVCLAIAGDFAALLAASGLALFNRQFLSFNLPIKEFKPMDYSQAVILGAVVMLLILQFRGAYQKHQFLHRFYMIKVVSKALAIWTLVFVALAFIFGMQSTVSRLFIFWTLVDAWVLFVVWRAIFRQLLFVVGWATILRDRVIVVGWSIESNALAQTLQKGHGASYEIIGCTPSAHGKFWVRPPNHVPVLGDYNALRAVLQEYQPDTVILADLDPVMGELVSLAQLCVKENVQFKVIPSFFQIFASGLSLQSIGGVPVIGISQLPLDRMHRRLLKQLVDIIGATVGLILGAPLIAIFGILIYRESPGPIFYSQNRTGLGGRAFRIYKLRSMKLDSEAGGFQWAKENDPRRLKIGACMRRLNIDEIPQFWNVLRGDMSLVGPRPEQSGLIDNFKEQIDHYNARHFVKPGITGYAQINGLRGNTDLKERVRYDLYYLENWSLWFDFQILFRTLFAHTNAY